MLCAKLIAGPTPTWPSRSSIVRCCKRVGQNRPCLRLIVRGHVNCPPLRADDSPIFKFTRTVSCPRFFAEADISATVSAICIVGYIDVVAPRADSGFLPIEAQSQRARLCELLIRPSSLYQCGHTVVSYAAPPTQRRTHARVNNVTSP